MTVSGPDWVSWPSPCPAQLPFAALNAALKAAGEATRLRILALLAEAELTVSDSPTSWASRSRAFRGI